MFLLVFCCSFPPSDDDDANRWVYGDCACALPPQNNTTIAINNNDGIRTLSLLLLISRLSIMCFIEKKSARTRSAFDFLF